MSTGGDHRDAHSNDLLNQNAAAHSSQQSTLGNVDSLRQALPTHDRDGDNQNFQQGEQQDVDMQADEQERLRQYSGASRLRLREACIYLILESFEKEYGFADSVVFADGIREFTQLKFDEFARELEEKKEREERERYMTLQRDLRR